MPVARYLLFVGGVLLALLFISDPFLPKLPVADRASSHSAIIRIHSDQKWPERVVFDTSLPALIPAQIENAETDLMTSSRRWSGKHLHSCNRPMPISYNGPIRKSENRSCNVNAKELQRDKRRRLRASWRGNRSLVGLATACGEQHLARTLTRVPGKR